MMLIAVEADIASRTILTIRSDCLVKGNCVFLN